MSERNVSGEMRRRAARPRNKLFKRLTNFMRWKLRYDEKHTAEVDTDDVRMRTKRKGDDEPFISGDGAHTKLVDPELYYTEQQRNKQLTDQLIQSQKQLQDTCREWESQVSHLQKRVAQAEAELRSCKLDHAKERLKCALLVTRIKSYREELHNRQTSCQLLQDESDRAKHEKRLLEQKLQEASTATLHLERELAASKDLINDLHGQLRVLKQKTKTTQLDLETAELKDALREERKRVLDLSSRLKSSHRAVKESTEKEAALRDALSVQQKKCAQLRRKVEVDQVKVRKVLSREQVLQAALDIDKSIMTELSNRLADHQKLNEELKAALNANRNRPTVSP